MDSNPKIKLQIRCFLDPNRSKQHKDVKLMQLVRGKLDLKNDISIKFKEFI